MTGAAATALLQHLYSFQKIMRLNAKYLHIPSNAYEANHLECITSRRTHLLDVRQIVTQLCQVLFLFSRQQRKEPFRNSIFLSIHTANVYYLLADYFKCSIVSHRQRLRQNRRTSYDLRTKQQQMITEKWYLILRLKLWQFGGKLRPVNAPSPAKPTYLGPQWTTQASQ